MWDCIGFWRMAVEKRWVSQQCQMSDLWKTVSPELTLPFVCLPFEMIFHFGGPEVLSNAAAAAVVVITAFPTQQLISKKPQGFFGATFPPSLRYHHAHHTPKPELGIHKPSIIWIPLCYVFFSPSTSCTYCISRRGQRGWHLCALMMIWSRSFLTHICSRGPCPRRSVVLTAPVSHSTAIHMDQHMLRQSTLATHSDDSEILPTTVALTLSKNKKIKEGRHTAFTVLCYLDEIIGTWYICLYQQGLFWFLDMQMFNACWTFGVCLAGCTCLCRLQLSLFEVYGAFCTSQFRNE